MSKNLSSVGKWSAKQYLEASLEEIVDKANDSTHKSEISFITAVLNAKSHLLQKKSFVWMSSIAIITACTSMLSLVIIFINKPELSADIVYLTKENMEIKEKIISYENRILLLEKESEKLLEERNKIKLELERISSSFDALNKAIHSIKNKSKDTLKPEHS